MNFLPILPSYFLNLKMEDEKLFLKKHLSLINLIESCNVLDPKNLKPLNVEVSDEFVGIKNSINNLIERILYSNELTNNYKEQILFQKKEIEIQNKELADLLTKKISMQKEKKR